ncbi:MAG: hypothetical protein JWN29_2413 [Acidimicrobiales bacterium]|nr:hypothetical protein [Acidimicrobiales bacterium]
MMTDDDIRSMLHTKAQEATVSDDAWDKIAARLGRADAPVRDLPRRLALVGVAAAAVAGTVVVANLPTSNVAHTTTTTSAPTSDVLGIEPAVSAWLAARIPDSVHVGMPHVTVNGRDTATVRFTGGQLATELFLQPLSGRKGWGVVSAASDFVLIDNPTYDGHELVASAVAEMDGQMTTTYIVDGKEVPGGTRRATHTEQRALGSPIEGAQAVTVRVVLVTTEGVTAIAEMPAQMRRDPATAVGSMVAVWPATDSAGLAVFQQDADAGRRADLLDPQAVAGGFLSSLLPRNETPTSFSIGEFQRGDSTSGEVPYTLSDGSSGTVLVRTTGEAGRIWYVTGATSDTLEILTTRREETHLVADVQSKASGTLTWTNAVSVRVQAGEKVSIGRPDTPLGNYPVVVRLMNGKRTLAIAAQLG